MKAVLSCVVVVFGLMAFFPAVGEYVWIEGETGDSNIDVVRSGWGNTEFLSDGNWLHLSIDQDKVQNEVPEEGVLISHAFRVKQAGRHEIWNRIGFEFARSPFAWRVDSGTWQTVSPQTLTTDLMEIDWWCEVAWLRLGEESLRAGEHQLQIRLIRQTGEDGSVERLLYASDAICISSESFRPNGKYPQGETGRTAEDVAAGDSVFELPETALGERASVSMGGVWEVARDDEQMPGEVAAPIDSLPDAPIFRAIKVPSDKNTERKDLVFAHRLWYRTRVWVPASMDGRSFFIDFPLNNLNTTVYVNGVFCGFQKDPFCGFQIDVTRGIEAGRQNEIWVGIRDAWYGRAADPDRPLKLRATFNYPASLFSEGFQELDYPIWNCPQSGILCTPTFVAAGSAYATDAFVQPSVRDGVLKTELTCTNTSDADFVGEVHWAAVEDATGDTAQTFPPSPLKLAAGATTTLDLEAPWKNPTLWWPDEPHMYRLETRIVAGGKCVDLRETPFGFREWRVDGTKFTLNGVTWHMWGDLVGSANTPEEWLGLYRRHNLRLFRFSTAGQAGQDPHWFGMEPRQALDFFDRHGVVLRRNTTLDGERIGTAFSEDDPETVRKQNGSHAKLTLMKNWRDQCVAQVKAERNHPSIQVWSIENEFAFINLINLLGNSPLMDEYEAEIKKTHDAVLAVDPTRAVMIDGGGALKDNTLGVHGDHYVATLDSRYPGLAYLPFVDGGGRGRWQWDMRRPRYLGEDFYAAGLSPADYARWGGEVAFQGRAAARHAVTLLYRMLNEGYRWGGHYAAWQFWLEGGGDEECLRANAPRAVLCRQWDWTFGSGQTVSRQFGVFNDSRDPAPMTFTRALCVGEDTVFSKTTTHHVAPGTVEKFEEKLVLPEVSKRTEATLVLTLSAGGRELFRDEKAVSILAKQAVRAASDAVAVYDPNGRLASFLRAADIPFSAVASLQDLSAAAKVLVVGTDALGPMDSASPLLAAFAAEGRAVVVLDQANPLRYQALPAEMQPAPATTLDEFGAKVPCNSGCTAFVEDGSHPALAGLANKDFFTWAPDEIVYREAYMKPTRGAKSLVQTGPRLSHTALVEVAVGKGVLYLCQLKVGDRLDSNAVAQRVVLNLLSTGLHYKQEIRQVAAAVDDPQLTSAMAGIGLEYEEADSPLAAVNEPGKKVAIVSANPGNLAALAGNLDQLRAFWDRGGTVLLHGLTPEGLADFNAIVGMEHLIRPFGRERVTFAAVRDPLTAGLTTGDIVLLSGERIFGWSADEYVASDMFTFVVDHRDVAPFADSDFQSYANITNGFVGSDGWPLIIDFPISETNAPHDIGIRLPREEAITEFVFDQSTNYNPTTKIALIFDGAERLEFAVEPVGEAQSFAIDPPRKARNIVLQTCDWRIDPSKGRNQGIDNIAIHVLRDAAFIEHVKPLLNVGGLMHYPKGDGGVVLCNLLFQEHESVPANKDKKQRILATILRNLKAPFAGDRAVIAGAGLNYTPVDIHTRATTYRDERGWFGDPNHTFKKLPSGRNTFAGVLFDVYEMATSPVPQVLMLGGPGVPGDLPREIRDIPVGMKADALFFLHTARIENRMSPEETRDGARFEMFKYVVHYEDGQTVEVPVYAETDIDHYVQPFPKAIPGAFTAWAAPYETGTEWAMAFAKQWTNPRPGVAIRSLDMIMTDDSRGVPALLAITAATGE